MAKLGDYIQHWALKRAGRALDWPGARSVDLGDYTIDNTAGHGDAIDLGDGGHVLAPVIVSLAAVDWDGGDPTDDAALSVDLEGSFDGETWPDDDLDVRILLQGAQPGPFNTVEVPRTLQAGVLVVPSFVRVVWEWGGGQGASASASFSVAVSTT